MKNSEITHSIEEEFTSFHYSTCTAYQCNAIKSYLSSKSCSISETLKRPARGLCENLSCLLKGIFAEIRCAGVHRVPRLKA